MKLKTKIAALLLCFTMGCVKETSSPGLVEPLKLVADTPGPGPGEMLPFTAGQPCALVGNKPAPSSCGQGQLCVDKGHEPGMGVCLIDCSEKMDGALVKNHTKCPKDWRCMTKKSNTLTFMGNFCAKPQEHRDMPCEAPFDRDACLNAMTCMPTIIENSGDYKKVFSRPLCKEECVDNTQCSRENESCLNPTYARLETQKIPGSTDQQECSLKDCQNADKECSCDKPKGFSCEPMMPGIDLGVCMRPLGVCGEAIPLARKTDFKGTTFFGKTCNEIADNRICQNPFDQDLKNNARATCIPISSTKEGACIAACSRPSFELNRPNKKLNCPSNYSCQDNVARKLGAYLFVKNQKAPKTCDFSKCIPGIPCPLECGPGSAECLEIGTGDKKEFLCGAPYGTCEPN